MMERARGGTKSRTEGEEEEGMDEEEEGARGRRDESYTREGIGLEVHNGRGH